ncbi:branched-chain amino acid ABC transporter permease [Caballeronia zhejiangensis]|uniref:branched-chain amino acid ABC transporter permease n=1 Tax=Caballeronia zhejiangensis TaxID=871203 RepID=UPI001EF6D1ED|nr:branched-chain amino acid ABC transporter permease [Caballeronia zhejiangensis]MCG7400339.1 branched-chain amino acid ABC transporter permease [Caballeronia zhejiangensis]
MESIISTGLIGLSLGTQYALISIGFTLIFGILGVINFAHGGFYILGGYVAFTLSHTLGLPYVAAVVIATLATGVLGYVIEFVLVDKHVNDHIATMILTLGIYLVMTTGIIGVYGPEPAEFTFPVSGAWRSGGVYMPYSNLIVFVVCTLAIAGVYYLIFKTRYGIALRAMADDRAVATAQGIRPSRMFPLAFGIATSLAGLTGALVTPILALEPHGGEAVVTKAFIIVILGGLGSVGGATVAAFIVGMVESYTSVYFGGSKGALALFLLVLVILLVRPSGLMGRETRKA